MKLNIKKVADVLIALLSLLCSRFGKGGNAEGGHRDA